MEQNNSITGQQVAGPNGVGGSQNGGGYNHQGVAARAGAGATVAAPASASVTGTVAAHASASVTGTGAAAGAIAGPSSQSGGGKKRGCHRHSQQQIYAMEAYFKNCPHPDEMQRNELARTLGLDPAQVKFWFQNKRTQLKTQTTCEENEALRSENDELRAENEALRNNTCVACSAGGHRLSMEENDLRLENIRLREEIERLKSQVARLVAGQNSQNVPDSQNLPIILRNRQNPAIVPHLGLGYLSNSTGSGDRLKLLNVPTSDEFRQSISELVVSAAEELKVMAMAAEQLWIPSGADGVTSVLNEVEYLATFPNNFGPSNLGYTCEASRHIAKILLNPKNLLKVLMDVNVWSYMFSPIVSGALTLDVLSMGEEYNAALQVMGAEYHIPTPLVPNREVYFARYCTKHCEGVWAVVDVSMDNILPTPEIMTCKKRPSGCLIQEMADGTSKITWIEHVYVDNNGVNNNIMYKRLLHSGLGFGAKRWVSTLQRQCQRLATANTLASIVPSAHNFNNLCLFTVMSSPERKRGILRLAERMVNDFNLGITGSKTGKWTKLYENLGDGIRLMTKRVVDDPGLPNGTLLSVATSFALALAPSMVFDFFRDHKSRKEWDIFANGNDYEPVFHISYGEEASNCVSIYKVTRGSQGYILQESWNDPVASHIVFAPTEIGTLDVILSGGDPNSVPILPSGFTILPDGPSFGVDGSCGTLLTVSFQVLINRSSKADIDMVAAKKVTNLLRCSCQKIKHALGAGGPNT